MGRTNFLVLFDDSTLVPAFVSTLPKDAEYVKLGFTYQECLLMMVQMSCGYQTACEECGKTVCLGCSDICLIEVAEDGKESAHCRSCLGGANVYQVAGLLLRNDEEEDSPLAPGLLCHLSVWK